MGGPGLTSSSAWWSSASHPKMLINAKCLMYALARISVDLILESLRDMFRMQSREDSLFLSLPNCCSSRIPILHPDHQQYIPKSYYSRSTHSSCIYTIYTHESAWCRHMLICISQPSINSYYSLTITVTSFSNPTPHICVSTTRDTNSSLITENVASTISWAATDTPRPSPYARFSVQNARLSLGPYHASYSRTSVNKVCQLAIISPNPCRLEQVSTIPPLEIGRGSRILI